MHTHTLTVVVCRYISTSLINTTALYYCYQKSAIRQVLVSIILEGIMLFLGMENVEHNIQENIT